MDSKKLDGVIREAMQQLRQTRKKLTAQTENDLTFIDRSLERLDQALSLVHDDPSKAYKLLLSALSILE